MIRSKQNVELRPALDRLDAYLVPSALGNRPADIYWTFSPLSVMDEEQASKVEKSDAETLKIYVDAGVIPNEVANEAVKNRLIEGGRFPGIEKAYSDYDAGLLVPDLDEGDEPEPERVVAANDAAMLLTDKLSDDERREVIERLWKYLSGEPVSDPA